MMFIYNKTATGYAHINNGVVCQDYSEAYTDDVYKIITACDGHGGKIYIRSDKGAKFASESVVDVITSYSLKKLNTLINENGLEKLKLEILCRWNELVEADYEKEHFTESELAGLTDEEKFKLKNNYILGYGTTLNAAIVTKNHLICIQIGDGGMFFVKRKKMEIVFPENDSNVANITNSLCGDNAFGDLFIKVVNKDKYNGVILCTDGFLGPYQTYKNFYESFLLPFTVNFQLITQSKIAQMDDFIDQLGSNLGIGDDVSFGAILYKV